MKRFRRRQGLLWILLGGWLVFAGCGESPKKLVHQAEQKFDAGDYLGALALYEQVSENFPKHQVADDALYWIGLLQHLYLKDDIKGLQAFEKVVKDYPASPFAVDAQRYTAHILERQKKTRQAIEAHERLMEMAPDPKLIQESQYRIGQLYFESGDLEQAKNEWDALLKKYPEGELSDKALYGVSSTYFIQGHYQEALSFLEQLIQNHPRSELITDAKFRAASCLEEEGRLQEALARFKEVADSYPNRQVVEMKIKTLTEQLEKL